MKTTLIGLTIRTERKSLGLTPSELAARCGLEQSVIDRIENGDTIKPHDKTLHTLANALAMPFDLLKAAASRAIPNVTMVRESSADYLTQSPGVTVIYKGLEGRHQVLVNELRRYAERGLGVDPEAIIRHAGLVSSLSILDAAQARDHTIYEESRRAELLEEERNLLIRCIETGITVRCLISPDTYWQRLYFHYRGFQDLTGNVLREAIASLSAAELRLRHLIDVIEKHTEYRNLQVVLVPQLSTPNMFLFGSRHVVYGRKPGLGSGYQTTISIQGGALMQSEIADFDWQCQDTAEHIAGDTPTFLDKPKDNILQSYALKQKVLEELKGKRERFQRFADGLEGRSTVPYPMAVMLDEIPNANELWKVTENHLDAAGRDLVTRLLNQVSIELMKNASRQSSTDRYSADFVTAHTLDN